LVSAQGRHFTIPCWSNIMNTKFRKLIIASGVALALGATSGAFAEGPMSANASDARLEAQISTTYALSPHLQAGDITVSVQDGKATLTGAVPEDINRELAGQFALSVDGVTEVDNQLVIDADHARAEVAAGPSFGDRLADATITAVVKSRLIWTREAEGLATEVSTESGRVTLEGTAESQAARNLAGRLAADTRGVVSVDNRLEVREPGAAKEPGAGDAAMEKTREVAADAGDYITDSWITTKVKSTFMWSSGISSMDISVTTDDGVVALSGNVDSEAERELAVELARELRGVKSVDASGLAF
jgi:hyperosmotically inducible periplasmic protein